MRVSVNRSCRRLGMVGPVPQVFALRSCTEVLDLGNKTCGFFYGDGTPSINYNSL